ncbi:hypothetical protein JTB14_018397 [Gonioctena quinquepunctata]|nr:hypothetical protein JTB14_018397 [Gonioctena quinquepunctata]
MALKACQERQSENGKAIGCRRLVEKEYLLIVIHHSAGCVPESSCSSSNMIFGHSDYSLQKKGGLRMRYPGRGSEVETATEIGRMVILTTEAIWSHCAMSFMPTEVARTVVPITEAIWSRCAMSFMSTEVDRTAKAETDIVLEGCRESQGECQTLNIEGSSQMEEAESGSAVQMLTQHSYNRSRSEELALLTEVKHVNYGKGSLYELCSEDRQ